MQDKVNWLINTSSVKFNLTDEVFIQAKFINNYIIYKLLRQ